MIMSLFCTNLLQSLLLNYSLLTTCFPYQMRHFGSVQCNQTDRDNGVFRMSLRFDLNTISRYGVRAVLSQDKIREFKLYSCQIGTERTLVVFPVAL